ncbi:DNA dependent Protein Kinase catalytic subunit [Ramazzottius varieornatus]|uniref:DNA dependent Protein Kinase catalytic subunit n=1 Tax=Ramazzottius varieornatus TaxID=947166 RepID=A0A1D1UR95_RAMVA|nr:DNA dependent Protein Kinase catalytic subunit [Ramazzottius varieornatus]
MTSRDIKVNLEALRTLVEENAITAALNVDDEGVQLVEQIGLFCMSDAGLQELNVIVPILVQEESSSLCSVLESAAATQPPVFPSTVDKGLELLTKLLELARNGKGMVEHFQLHLSRIRETAMGIWRTSSSAKARVACITLLSEVVEAAYKLKKINDAGLSDVLSILVPEIRRSIKSVSATVKFAVYGFWGLVAQKAPLIASKDADSIASIFVSELRSEERARDPKPLVTAGALEGFTGFLCNFAGLQICLDNMDLIFKIVREAIQKDDVKRYAFITAALGLMSKHAGKFSRQILGHKGYYAQLYSSLKGWAMHGNREVQKICARAVDNFLKEVARGIVVNLNAQTDVENSTAAFKFFIAEFNEKIKKADSALDMSVAIRGYGSFAAPARLLSSSGDILLMIHEMVQKSEQMFFTADASGDRLHHLPDFVDTLASMAHDVGSDVPDMFLFAIQRMSVLMVEQFPKFGPPAQHYCCRAIVKVIIVVSRFSCAADDLISTIIYQALRNSCSYPVPEANPDAANASLKKPTTYKDFQPLWEKLLGCEYMKEVLNDLQATEVELYGVANIVFDEFAKASLRILKLLNFDLLDVSPLTVDPTFPDDSPTSNDFLPIDKKPSNEQDFQIFFSLEQVTKEIFKKVKADFVVAWTGRMSRELILLSEKHPLVSGFYRFLSIWYSYQRMPKETNNFEEEVEDDGEGWLAKEEDGVKMKNEDVQMVDGEVKSEDGGGDVTAALFLQNLIGRIQHFSDEVLISALHLILDFPVNVIRDNLSSLPNILVLALQTGKSFLPLTEATVKALERWCFHSSIERSLLDGVIAKCLPVLDDYLRSTTLDVSERSEVLGEGSGKRRRKAAKVTVVLGGDDVALTRVREAVMSFLGQLGGGYNHLLLEGEYMENVKNLAIVWDMQKHLQFQVPFIDMILGNFYLDDFLPRLTELCLHDPDRSTKVAACELLHAVTVFLIGTHANTAAENSGKKSLLTLLQKLMPKIIELACDVEPVTKQLFEPLIVEIIHHFSHHAQKIEGEVGVVLDCLMDGLVTERNPTIRSFCARCVSEFLQWSAKGSKVDPTKGSKAIGNSPPPVASVSLFERIISFAGHSRAAKRFGAALAFNNCYRLFRDDSVLVDMFTINLIVTFVKSLAWSHMDIPGFGADKLTASCLDHLARIVEKYGKDLNKTASRRTKIPELKEARLDFLVDWLLLQACRPETACRMKCWQLVDRFAKALKSSTSAAPFFDELIRSKNPDWLTKAFLNGGNNPDDENNSQLLQPADFTVTLKEEGLLRPQLNPFERLAATVDCFALVFMHRYINPKTVCETKQWETFGRIVKVYLEKFMEGLSEEKMDVDGLGKLTTVEQKKLTTIICTIFIRLTDLVTVIVTKHGAEHLPEVLSGKEFAEVLVRATIDPTSVGFDLGDKEVAKSLLNQLKGVLVALNGVKKKKISSLVECATKLLSIERYDVVKMVEVENTDLTSTLSSGFVVLHECGLTEGYLKHQRRSGDEVGKMMMKTVLTLLARIYQNSGSRKEAWVSADVKLERAIYAMALVLEPEMNVHLDFMLTSADGRDVMYPKVRTVLFGHVFSEEAVKGNRVEVLVEGLMGGEVLKVKGREEWAVYARVGKEMLEYVLRNRMVRKKHGERVTDVTIEAFGGFLERYPGDLVEETDDIRVALQILKMLLVTNTKLLKTSKHHHEPIFKFYTNLLKTSPTTQELMTSKNSALGLLSFFLDSTKKKEMEKNIEHIYINDFPIKSAELKEGSAQRAFYLQAVTLILSAIDNVPSAHSVVEVCVKMICRDTDHPLLNRFQESFEAVALNATTTEIQNILGIPWKIFASKTFGAEHRKAACELVLLPMLRSAPQHSRAAFYEAHMESIVEHLDTKERSPTRELLTVQTCCFNLLEILCATTPKVDLTSPTSPVVKAFVEASGGNVDSAKGTELVAYISRTADKVAHENVEPEKNTADVRLELHCAAYNALASAMTATQMDLRFYYKCLFEEVPEQGRFLWENLVDIEKSYVFPVEFLQTPKRQQRLAAVHKEITGDTNGSMSAGIFTMSSYASARASVAPMLQESSLMDELGRFDFTNGTSRSTSVIFQANPTQAASVIGSVELEMDELNRHVCMPTLVALIQHMIVKNISPMGGDMPKWVNAIKDKLEDKKTKLNVRLFLAKLIVNMENSSTPVFGEHADELYAGICEVLLSMDWSGGINYFIADLIHIMLVWSMSKMPSSTDSEALQRVFVRVLKNVMHSNTGVQKKNLQTVRLMAEKWKPLLESPPKHTISSLLTNDKTKAKENIPVINIVAILLDANLPLTVTAFEEYRRILGLHMKESSKPLYRVAALVMGLLIARAIDIKLDKTHVDSTVDEVRALLTAKQDSNKDQFIETMHQVSRSYPKIVKDYLNRIFFVLPTLFGPAKAKCLEILLSAVDDIEHPFIEFKERDLLNALKYNDEKIQGLTLQLYQGIAKKMEPQEFSELLTAMSDIFNHNSPLLRQRAYEFCMWMYDHFENGKTKEEKSVMETVRIHLFAGLKDRDQTVRDLLTAFWASEKRLTGTTFARLIALFKNLLHPELETTFLSTCCHLLLDLCRNAPLFDKPLFKKLSDCEFFRQDIETTFKQRSSMAPITANSFSSSTFGASFGSSSQRSHTNLRTQVFTPTQATNTQDSTNTLNVSSFTYGSQFSQSLLIDLPHRDLVFHSFESQSQPLQDSQTVEADRVKRQMDAIKQRFQQGSDQKSKYYFARRELDKRKASEEKAKQDRENRNMTVKLSRTYRTGDVPDVEIPYSALIAPMQILTDRDAHTAGKVLKSLFKCIVEEARKNSEAVDEALEGLVVHLNEIIKSEQVADVMFLSTLLNIVSEETSRLLELASADAITSGALKAQQPHLGIAVLEKKILTAHISEPAPKKGRRTTTSAPTIKSENWLGLYRLLESVGDTDSIHGLKLDAIFGRESADDIIEAIGSECRGDHTEAMRRYKKLQDEPQVDEAVNEVLQQSHFRCLEELGQWKDLQESSTPSAEDTATQLDSLDALWDKPGWVEKVMPYAIKAKLMLSLQDDQEAEGDLAEFFNNALAIPQRKQLLERNYGWEIATFCLKRSKYSEAEFYLKLALKGFLEDWAGTPQLNQHSRRLQMPLVQLIEESKRYTKTREGMIKEPDAASKLAKQFLVFLAGGDRYPHPTESASVWNQLVTDRCFLAGDINSAAGNRVEKEFISAFTVSQKLKLGFVASRQHRFRLTDAMLMQSDPVARRAFPESTHFAEPGEIRSLQDRFLAVYVEAAVERAKHYGAEPEHAQKNFSKLVSALKLINNARDSLQEADARSTLQSSFAAKISHSIAELLTDHASQIKLQPADQKELGLAHGTSDLKPLYLRVFTEFTELCETSTDADSFLETFRYCDRMIGKGVLDDSVLATTGTSVLLKAIELGSVEARDLFCRLLVWLREYPKIWQKFRQGCAECPSWMFISWTNQMLAILDKKEGPQVFDILLRLSQEYPNAVTYGYKISKEGYVFEEDSESGRKVLEYCDRLDELLSNNLVDDFLRQLILISNVPTQLFSAFMKTAENLVKEQKFSQLQREFLVLYNRLFTEQGKESSSRNPTWKNFQDNCREEFLKVFGREGKKVPTSGFATQFKEGKKRLYEVLQHVDANKKKFKELTEPGTARLADLNLWMAQFSPFKYGTTLEIPGQYDGKEKPRPEDHVKIVAFGDEVLILGSKQRPKRIVFRGDDEKDYFYLVKGGEDIRLDQRVEQLFVLMNRIFSQDADCAKRRLQIKTYAVVPMSSHVGLIEWVQNSATFRDFLVHGDKETDSLFNLTKYNASKWLEAKVKAEHPTAYNYYAQIPTAEIRAKLAEWEKRIPPHLLRQRMQELTVSPDAFCIVRNHFAEALGAMSMAQYVLGIGDRHLSNNMISMETGIIFPIDFGYAFGSGTQFLPVPELVPFRLTRQITNLMHPQTNAGKYQQTMIHALRALRKERQILMATMDVFIQEPSMDWLSNARRVSAKEATPTSDLTWFAKDKIAIVGRKLLGENPAYITRDEALANPWFPNQKSVLFSLKNFTEWCLGDKDSVRRAYPQTGLSVEAQVQCLIDQATDSNLLGRIFVGWDAWV